MVVAQHGNDFFFFYAAAFVDEGLFHLRLSFIAGYPGDLKEW